MKSITRTIFVIITMSIAGLFNSAQAVDLPKTAKILPPDTILLVDIENFSQLKTQFEKTNWYRLYKDPAMAGFFESLKAKLLEEIKKEDEDIAGQIIESNIFPQGRLAVAMLPSKPQDKNEDGAHDDMNFILISQWGKNLEKLKEVLDKEIKKSIETGYYKKNEAYRGVDIVTIIKQNPPKQVPDFSAMNEEQNDVPMKTIQQPPTKTYHCFVDDCLMFSSDIETLKFSIAHIQGATSPTMYTESDYSSAIAATGPGHDLDFYVNIKQLFKSLAQNDSNYVQNTITGLGLDNLVSISSSVAVAKTPQNPVMCKAFVKIEGTKKGVCKMLEAVSAPVKAPKFIPDSTYSVSFLNLDIKNAYDQLATILNSFSPQYATVMYMDIVPPSPDGQPGIAIKRDIIEHLGKQIIISQSINKPFTESTMPQYLFAVEVNNRASLEKTFSAIYNKFAPGDSDAIRQFMGYTIYSFKSALPFFAPSPTKTLMQFSPQTSPQQPKLGFTITDTHLVFGAEDAVEQVIRSLSDTGSASLASKKWFNAAKEQIPELTGFAGLEDTAAQMELLWWTLKNNKPKDHAVHGGMFGSFDDLMDTTTLPEFETVKKYFGLSTSYGITLPDGFFFELKDVVTP